MTAALRALSILAVGLALAVLPAVPGGAQDASDPVLEAPADGEAAPDAPDAPDAEDAAEVPATDAPAGDPPNADLAAPAADPGSTPDTLRSKLQDESKQLEERKQSAATREKKVLDLAKQREELNAKLIQAGIDVQKTEQELTRAEERIAELAVSEKQLRGDLLAQNQTLIKLLGALQRMGRDPPPVMITQRNDALKMVRSALQLSSVFPELRDKALVLAEKLGALDKVLAEARNEGKLFADAKLKHAEDEKRLSELIESNKTEMAAEIERLGIDREQIEEGMRAVADLTGALNTVVAKVEQLPALRSTLGKYDQELETANLQTPQEVEPEPAAPVPAQAKQDPARIKPATPFARMKGRLSLPVEGKNILGFGDVTKTGIRLKGQAYSTRAGALVTAPCDGWVVYAGEFRNYGQLLIINAGGGYHLLLAGLSQVDVTMGQFVLARQPVGRMGAKRYVSSQTAAPAARSADTSPLFYVEFRHKEQPINPAPWWSAVAEKVQG